MIETDGTAEATATTELPAEAEGASSQPARRATKFMAELSRAMQAAAEHARSETMARFEVDAKSVVEEIHARATDEAADLRRKADDDVATIREWSKTEIARIREETEARITARKAALDGEMEAHAATIGERTERVSGVVAAFEGQMRDFFERMNAEEDPTRIATMAETMPEPPSLPEIVASFVPSPRSTRSSGTPTDADFAAAEAEAASFSGDLEGDDYALTIVRATPVEAKGPKSQAQVANANLSSTRVAVTGLASVANIANFKRSLTRLAGISTIAVASGPEGEFVFTIGHTLGSALSAALQALPGFDIQLNGESDDAIKVAARDRDAAN